MADPNFFEDSDFFAPAPTPTEDPPEQLEISIPEDELDDNAREILADPDIDTQIQASMKLVDYPWAKGLTYKQTCFVLAFAGDTSDAAKMIGIPYATCNNWLKLPNVRYAIRERLKYGVAPELVASRDERLATWTQVMRDESRPMAERLKASELLGKANCDFSEKRVLAGTDDKPVKIVVDTGIGRRPGDDAIDVTPNGDVFDG